MRAWRWCETAGARRCLARFWATLGVTLTLTVLGDAPRRPYGTVGTTGTVAPTIAVWATHRVAPTGRAGLTAHPKSSQRRSVCLQGYDYALPGRYFVTVCTYERNCTLGKVVDGQMRPNGFGDMVREEWFRTAKVRPQVSVDAFVVMPNHVHGMIEIAGATRRVVPTNRVQPGGPGRNSLGAIVGQFKSVTSKRINGVRGTPGQPVWQRNYYEHVIRNEAALNKIREYICANPEKWPFDRDNPGRTLREDNELEEILAADVGGLEGW